MFFIFIIEKRIILESYWEAFLYSSKGVEIHTGICEVHWVKLKQVVAVCSRSPVKSFILGHQHHSSSNAATSP